MGLKLFIDLDKCRECGECKAQCSYYYRQNNKGAKALIEYLTFSVICRQCEEAPCIESCYHSALYKLADGRLKRSNFLCTSCKSCYIACPFGTILNSFLGYKTPYCDLCKDRDKILCIESCPYKAIELKEIESEDIEKGIYFVDENIAVKTTKWIKNDLTLKKR